MKQEVGSGSTNRLAWAAALVVGAAVLYWLGWGFATHQGAPTAPASMRSESDNPPPLIFAPSVEQPAGAALNPHAARTAPSYPDPEEQLAVSADQHLLINEALLIAFNHYLVDQAGDGDKAELLVYLKARFPAAAFNEAVPLVTRYQDYLQAHDRQLAIQVPQPAPGVTPTFTSTTEPDLPRIRAWIAQRAQLRQSLLGAEATRAWYQNDDSQLQQALDELEARQQMASGGTPSSTAGPIPHWSEPAEEARHVQDLRNLLTRATTSFQSLQPRAR